MVIINQSKLSIIVIVTLTFIMVLQACKNKDIKKPDYRWAAKGLDQFLFDVRCERCFGPTTDTWVPKCGDNNITYANQCEFDCLSARMKHYGKTVVIKSQGECYSGQP